MQRGKIVQLLDRDIGFIRMVGIKEPVFFHADDLTDSVFAELHEGDAVTFLITESLKGPYATQVSKNALK